MSIRSWLSDVLKPAETSVTDDIEHGRWSSSRLVLLVAFVAMILYTTKGILSPENVRITAYSLWVFIICNTVSKCWFGWLNKAAPAAVTPKAP